MQALIDAATLELPRSLVEIELQRMVQQARADLEARGVKLEKLPLNPEALEGQARRRVTLGLILGELVRTHDARDGSWRRLRGRGLRGGPRVPGESGDLYRERSRPPRRLVSPDRSTG